MKSKSFDFKQSKPEKAKYNKTLEFVGYYKSVAETNNNLERNKSAEGINKENNFKPPTSEIPKRRRSSNKNKNHKSKNESLDISQINIDGHSLNASFNKNSSVAAAKTSTSDIRKAQSEAKVKSIMKNSSTTSDDAMESTDYNTPQIKPKKRNKSVSFMLDDSEEVVIKRTKSDDSLKVVNKSNSETDKRSSKVDKRGLKDKKLKMKKNFQAEKENKSDESSMSMECNDNEVKQLREKKAKLKIDNARPSTSEVEMESTSDSQVLSSPTKKKKYKKIKKQKKTDESSEQIETESTNTSTNDNLSDNKDKKSKKKKRLAKSSPVDSTETEGEPKKKFRKTEIKAEVLSQDLGNLSIGDNAHTLSNLLDEMTVVDKNKKKKNKRKSKKSNKQVPSTSSSETADLEKIVEGKEKTKWKKRKWNKFNKAELNSSTSVIIENLPLTIMLTYKTLLTDHFTNCGPIKKIGVAEFYPAEQTKLVFTTLINFQNTDAVEKALEEDNTLFEGNRIRVKRPLPPTQTTVVIRSYADLSTQRLSSVFAAAGRIKNIQHAVKGKKSMVTAFIEFDGPEAVERAIKMAEDAKIGGKKIYISKYEHRPSKHREKEHKNTGESENEGDSENSNE